MIKGMRLLMAAATGAVLLLGGVHLSAANAATAGPDFSGAASSDAFIPLDKDVEVTVTLQLKDPGTVSAVNGTITPPGGSERPVGFDFRPSTAAETAVTGRFGIGKNDPAGTWRMTVKVTRNGATRDNAFTIDVSARQGIRDASVQPDPVQLVKGKDVKVSVRAGVSDATSVSAKLISDESNEAFDLGDLALYSDGSYRGETYFADDTAPGSWTLEVTATRGGQALKGVASFTVNAPAGGASKKARTRVTISAPAKAAKGRPIKVQGKVFRGSKAYPGKRLEVYFKAKGAKTYRLLGFAKSNTSGKYVKTYTARKDGYFRVKVPGTSTARSALSPQEFVDVRP
ncbi:hypothetical protein HTZ77_35205 [Nonomuraea sp. SMC257]|uniref:Ig-like domain repeat protein n=1 Tax=Nonomuraea montanisoli TaxID=2741721 RepID=A0A7Y6M7Q6_9ACTN|nr:hypothetical protein [Nonomuraea montanisoli]NUW36619.1 hypothetical protein [Nonomuraea montanisoli]